MTPLAEMIPAMSDADLASLRVNARRLVEHGASSQVMAASDILPVIDTELARRAALPKPDKAPPKRAPAKKKLPPVTGHQTALPARA
ncbi:MAG TPA: hypothetical protein VGN74_02435 [Brevundimonas sp.]|jgi:hypothetical protein|uniref:hypothetical protein n=1 Tax=Brevundimonas sp. TaxID=1871086 RepID=UPI002E13C250|nr:hypothetical protein [Brevundimonas sp.]